MKTILLLILLALPAFAAHPPLLNEPVAISPKGGKPVYPWMVQSLGTTNTATHRMLVRKFWYQSGKENWTAVKSSVLNEIKLPPMPPGVPAARVSTAPVKASIVPAAVVPAYTNAVSIFYVPVYGNNSVYVGGTQFAGNSFELQYRDGEGTAWRPFSQWGCYNQTQDLYTIFPGNFLKVAFFRSCNTPCVPAAARAAPNVPMVMTAEEASVRWTVKGVVYRFAPVGVSPDGKRWLRKVKA